MIFITYLFHIKTRDFHSNLLHHKFGQLLSTTLVIISVYLFNINEQKFKNGYNNR